MSEQRACAVATAFAEELAEAGATVASSNFLSDLARLHRTGHEHRLGEIFEKNGLQPKISTTWVNIGMKKKHPVLRIQDFLAGLSKVDKVGEMILQGHSFDDLRQFWELFRNHRPGHPAFQHHEHHLERCVPLYLFCDEGTGPKKRGLLVLQFQPILAKGSRRAEDINLAGSTYVNRFLYSVLLANTYSKSKVPLYRLLDHWATDLVSAFHDGVTITLGGKVGTVYPIVLGLKGDLAGLVKMGRLTRNWSRDSPTKANPPGICHLCQAGRASFPWFEIEREAKWLRDPHATRDRPWHHPSPLTKIPSDLTGGFFLIDTFHTLHKGVAGDFGASSLAASHDCVTIVFKLSFVNL